MAGRHTVPTRSLRGDTAQRGLRADISLGQYTTSAREFTMLVEGGRVAFASDACVNVLGVANAASVCGREFRALVAKGDRVRARAFLESILALPHDRQTGRFDLLCAHGTAFTAEISGDAISVGGSWIAALHVRDAGAQRAARVAVAWHELMVRAIGHASPHAIYIFDMVRGRFVYLNEACLALLGYPDRDGIWAYQDLQRHFQGTVFEELRARVHVWRTLKDSETAKVDYQVRDCDGGWHWLTSSEQVFRRMPDGTPREIVGLATEITERKATEEALRHSRARLAEAQRIAHLGHWEWTLETDRMDWSESMYEIYGLRPDSMEHTFEGFLSRVHPDEQELVRASFATALLGEAPYSLDFRIELRDGRIRVVHEQAEITLDHRQLPIRMIGTVQDVSDRKHVEEAIRTERDLAQNYLDVAAVLIMVLDPDERIRVLNRRGSEILECTESDVIGQNWFDTFVPAPHREAERALFHRMLTPECNEPAAFESKLLTMSGLERLISWRSAILDDGSGNVVGFLGSGIDITEQEKVEQAERARQQQLVQADKMISLGILIAGVAHEINNPNFVIMSSVDFMRKVFTDMHRYLSAYEPGEPIMLAGMPFAEASNYTDELLSAQERATERIKYIVHELRDYARMAPAEHVEPVRINSVVESAVTLLSNMVHRSTDRFIVEFGEDLPLILGNYRRLEQVVINLVQNGCQALTSSSQAVSLRTHYDSEGDRVVVEVLDEGQGIAPEHIPRITDPFFTTKRDSGGSGLGLSISASIVHEHRGLLLFDSDVGKGTRARVMLPAYRRDQG